ncbi:fatty acid desaturase family protein [Aquimarina agarilytica]|uniref:fatty acid desaturase family protein n=1 Tax=Aquimarina agarilytica TaxID=1087449 RepID=UPI0002892824|nr:acyl-CoA desaturase [Aquimarina agarilytica]
MKGAQIRFSRVNSPAFFKTLNRRVNTYFKEQNIKKTGNWKLHLKTMVMFTLFTAPYFLILLSPIPQWLMLILCVIMGIGMAGIGMNVMHDGNHGSYSSKRWVNKLMGSSMYFLAGNVYNWQVQHNVLHHTYTNIHGHDEDLDAGRIIRFSRHSDWKYFHKFQHIYSIFLYGLLTVNWVTTVDFKQTARYLKRKLSYEKLPNAFKQWTTVIVSKILYFSVWIVTPMLVLDVAWYKILLGFFVMHYVAGLILSTVFQLAHIIEETDTPLPSEEGTMKNTWAIHQLFTTTNFGTNNKFLSWFTGGLNHQVEHHIFPNISHVHYPKISKIIKETAKEFNLPYYEYKSMGSALAAHFRHLKHLGMNPNLTS